MIIVSGTKINRREFELYLRDMTSEIIDNNDIVKNIVDEVFEEININSLHKRYKNKDEAKLELVSFTRKKIFEYLDTCSEVDKYNSFKENLSNYAKKYYKYNMYFAKNNSTQFKYSDDKVDLIDAEIDKLSNNEKEILIRRFYFLQSSEKIASALNISTYKVYSLIRQLVKSLWSKVLLNDEIMDKDKIIMSDIVKSVEEYFKAISGKNKSFAKYKVVDKEVEEFFIIKLLSNSKLRDIEFTFDDICLESMSRLAPDEGDYENLEYLSIYKNVPQNSLVSVVKKKKAAYKKLAIASICGVMSLSMVLLLGENSFLAKASARNSTYQVSSTKLGLSFTYKKHKDNVDVDISQIYYVNDSSLLDYSDRIDTEMAVRVDRNNLYADLRNVEQTVYESASRYLSSNNEGGLKYKEGNRKYVYNDIYKILFVAEYMDGAWECTKVIYVDKIKEASKYHLDKHNVLQGFFVDSNDGKWKCELHSDKGENEFSEITFENDNSEMLGLGTYKTNNMTFKRTFDKKSGKLTMKEAYKEKDSVYEDEFLTYIIEDGITSVFYNKYENGKLKISDLCVVNNKVLENVVELVSQKPSEMLANMEAYGINIPDTNEYILPYLEYQGGNNTYASMYYEFKHYDIKEMEKVSDLALKVYTSGREEPLKAYRLYDNDYYKEVKNVEEYKKSLSVKNHIFYDKDVDDYKIRIFDNAFCEILEYKGNDIKVDIPEYLNGFEVWYIGNDVFKEDDTIKEVNIPKSVKEIGTKTFMDCENLERIEFKGNIVALGEETFKGCEELKEVELKNTPSYIGKKCFAGTKFIKKLKKENGVIYLKNAAIKLVEESSRLKLREDTVTIADGFLNNKASKIYSIEVPSNVKYIGKDAFADAKLLGGVELSSNMKYLGNGAFRNCINLKNITISSSIQVINEETFKGCVSLDMVELPVSLKAIRKNAFEGVGNSCKMKVSNNTTCIF